MIDRFFACHFRHWTRRASPPRFAVLAGAVFLFVQLAQLRAQTTDNELVIRPIATDAGDRVSSTKAAPATLELVGKEQPAAPVDAAAYVNHRLQLIPQQVNFQVPPNDTAESETLQLDLANNPCAAMTDKPLGELGINIAVPAGELPNDYASACWNQLNQAAGPLAAIRAWPTFSYYWNATCLCHRPLYFEQINLERYGYGCNGCLQPLASAAHFFGTIPALPYCMAVECPCECVYTLGHYRPGSCPPWRHHWPPGDFLAAAAEGGVWTGMIFLIP